VTFFPPLLQLCGGLLTPSAGRLQIGEHNVATMTEAELDRMRSGDVGIVLQGAGRNLVPYLTPADNIRYAQGAAPRGRTLPTPDEVLGLVGLQEHANTPLTSLTPGQVQLCAVAVGIATLPGLLLADEPTSQLDHRART
jgi:putative ABC transport system ATP-binding protein